ncbi:TonB-dependent siderophore receptor [Altererythrobacter xixiisoli]|uniref:TonB-dependent siderophore receptor n=1 Tax=Croceibacterium xixiisoli TaxID=1476466 RepID=A0A6I4TT15_9SPHN|nr:TonB-dependent receptor [Croceibacterium xixiisoli]MXO99295.1 TonB-dependent siderophore receptor [Croceibacterium xixiisoli]
MNRHILSGRATLASAVSILALASSPALAQQAAPADRQESEERDAIVVIGQQAGVLTLDQTGAGSRLGLSVAETPASVDVISKEMIRALGDRTIVAAASRAPGVINDSGSYGYSLSARGFTGYNSVMQLYDGMRVYTTSTQTFPGDPWMAERVDVLRGAASVLYGEGGIGGAVNVVRKQPNTTRHEGEFRVSGGSYNTFQVAGGLGGPVSDSLSYRVDASYNTSDGWVDRGEFSSLALSSLIRFQPTDTLTFTLSHDRFESDPVNWFGTPLRNGEFVPEIKKKNYNVGDRALEFDDDWTQFQIAWEPNDQLSISNVAYYLNSRKYWHNVERYAWSGPNIMRSSYTEILYDTWQIGNRLNLVYEHEIGGMEHRFSVGAEVNIAELKRTDAAPNSPNTSTIDPFDFDPGVFQYGAFGTRFKHATDLEQYAVFGESRLLLTPALSLVTGIRYDRPSVHRDDALDSAQSFDKTFPGVSWRAGLVYNPQDNIALYAQYSRATDPVTAFLTANLAQSAFEVSTGSQWEAGAKATFWGGRGEATISGYRIVKNKILSRSAADPAVQVQVGQQSSFGVEASFALAVSSSFSIMANGTLLNAEYDDFNELVSGALVSRDGNVPIGVANKAANLWLSWTPLDALQLDSGVRYVGRRYADAANERRMPGYTVVDASVRYDLTQQASVTLNLRNLLDKTYVMNAYGPLQWVIAEPRTAMLSLDYRF